MGLLLSFYAVIALLAIFPAPFLLFTLPFARLGLGSLGLVVALTLAWSLIALGWHAVIGRPMPILAFALALLITNSIDILAQQAGRPRSLTVGAQVWALILVGAYTYFTNTDAGWLR